MQYLHLNFSFLCSDCTQKGAHLAKLTSPGELKFLFETIKTVLEGEDMKDPMWWVGAHGQRTGNFTWLDGTSK